MRVALWFLALSIGGCAPPAPPPVAPAEVPRLASPQDRFVEAAGRGDLGEVDRRLLAADVAIDDPGATGTTALLAAIARGEAAMTKRLLAGGASAETEAGGHRPLVASADAAISADTIALALLAAGADPNRPDRSGRRPLIEHARRGHQRVVDALLAAGADVDTKDGTGTTALHAAAGAGHDPVVARLMLAKADLRARDRDGASALFHAAAGGHIAIVERLLEAGIEAHAQDARGRRPLGAALVGGHHDVARTLLQAGAPPDDNVWPPEGSGLVVVCARGDVEGAALLHAAGAKLDPPARTFSPLMAAASAGRVAMVRWLVSRGASVTAVDGRGQTALHMAAEAGQATIVAQLVAAGADVALVDDKGRRAVDLARGAGHLRVVDALAP